MPNSTVIVTYSITNFMRNQNCAFNGPSFGAPPAGTPDGSARASLKQSGVGFPINDTRGISLRSMRPPGNLNAPPTLLDIVFKVVGSDGAAYTINMLGFSQTRSTGDDQGALDFTDMAFNADGTAKITNRFVQAGNRGVGPAWTFALAITRNSDGARALVDPGIENTNDN